MPANKVPAPVRVPVPGLTGRARRRAAGAGAIGAALLLAACSAAPDPADAPPARRCPPLAGPAMVTLPAGDFIMGADPHYPEEGPPRRVHVDSFRIDTHELTNAEFARFVAATGYRTMAERTPPPLPGAPPEMGQPGSAVFTVPDAQDPRWWRWVPGAQWRHPSGPAESIAGKDRDPVVQIAYEDAQAYARWAGKALPSEAQWEYAARAGQPALPEPVDKAGTPQANYYQGVFPRRDLGLDGFTTRAPVGCFPPNAFGLYDMIGNVWEWTSEPATKGADPTATDTGGSHVIKGGSYLCAANYCARYRPSARQFQEGGLGANHVGVRLVTAVADTRARDQAGMRPAARR
ncbi:formylglycine-generating enzyme family protein [Sphingomonas sp. 28-63-12]|uniref:formylglycine-generating enzyme family protein n=1 Tax=Sphingomonas sp. 28-63-12 TaxID=1970434 RepID=UPI000BC601FF|nr:MAG: cysteine-type sulfatase aerobic maturase [Sphingomonas sp. 28-63-12]